jgi:hypothetical protein
VRTYVDAHDDAVVPTNRTEAKRSEPNRSSIYSSVGGSFVRSFVRSGGFDDDDDDDDAHS